MKFKVLSIKIMGGAMAMMLVVFSFFSCKESTAIETPVIAPVRVNIQSVTRVLDQMEVLAASFLEAQKTAPISFEVPGKIVNIMVDLGDRVKKNQVVARVEMADYQSRLEIAQAQFIKAQDAFTRLNPLFEEGVIPEKTLIGISSGLAEARAHRNIINKQVRDTKLRAPFSGVIGMKAVELGQMVSPGIPAFTIVKIDKLYACSSIPESEIDSIKIGQTSRVTIPALGGQRFHGAVTHIGAVADPKTRTYTVKILLDNPDYRMRPGMISNVSIKTDKQIEILTIPGRAVVRTNNLTYVFLGNKNNSRAFKKRVYTGAVHGSEIRIKTGLSPGDNLILEGQHKLTDGCRITAVN